MDSDAFSLGQFAAKCANAVPPNPQQILLANSMSSLCHPSYLANIAARLPHSQPNILPTIDPCSFSAKMFQMNAIQHNATTQVINKDKNNKTNGEGSSGQCHGTSQAAVVDAKITAGEEPTDSGNETSSLSPSAGDTPMTVSPAHSLPSSRSNSFSVSTILRVQQQQLQCDQKRAEHAAAQLAGQSAAAETEHTRPKSVQMKDADSGGTMKAQQRMPLQQLHQTPFGNQSSAYASPMMGHSPLHSAFRAPASVCAFRPPPPHPSVGGHPLGGTVFPYQHHLSGVLHPSTAPRAASLSSAAIAPLIFAPSAPGHGIHPFLLSNSAALLSLLHHQQLQQQQNECCVVCGDRASGHHYGVQSCEGCKGFFRRSIQEEKQFSCVKNDDCVVDKVSRNRCQRCRLAKCYRVGMQPTHVRLEKNRKRKNDSEQKDAGLEVTRQAVELINAVVKAFKSSFLTPASANGDTSAQLVSMPNLCAARHHCRQFVEAVPAFSAFPTDSLLSSDVVSAVLTVLIVLLKGDGGAHSPPHKAPLDDELDGARLGRVRRCFADLALRWEEVAVFVSLLITFGSRAERVEQMYKSLCHGLLIKLSERNAEERQNANPSDLKTETVDLYTKLVTNISQIFQRVSE